MEEKFSILAFFMSPSVLLFENNPHVFSFQLFPNTPIFQFLEKLPTASNCQRVVIHEASSSRSAYLT